MREYYQMVEPCLTDEKIEEILEEMRNHPQFFPPATIEDEVIGKHETTVDFDNDLPKSTIKVERKKQDVDFDDGWI